MIPGLDDSPHWVVFKFEGDKKPPYCARFPERNASATNHRTWATLEEALALVAAGKADGVGYALTAEDRIVFIDLDKCRNPKTGEVDPWAVEVLAKFADCYCEASVSGTGLHILCRGTLPAGGRRSGKIEMYWRERFMYASGLPLDGRDAIIDAPDGALRWLWEKVAGNGGGHDAEAYAVAVELDTSIAAVVALSERLKVARANDVELAYTWHLARGWHKSDGSPDWSNYDMSIAARLVRCGFTDDEIALAIVLFREEKCQASEDKGKPRRHRTYLGLTIGKARAGIEPMAERTSKELDAAKRKIGKAIEVVVDAEKATARAADETARIHQAEVEHDQAAKAAKVGSREEALEWISQRMRPSGDLKLVDVVRWGVDPGTVELTFDGWSSMNFGRAGDLDSPAKFRNNLLHYTEKMMKVNKALNSDWAAIVELLLKHARRGDAGDNELVTRLNDLIMGQVEASGQDIKEGDGLNEIRRERRTHVHAGRIYVFGKTLLQDTRYLGIEGRMLWGLLRGLGFEPTVVSTKKGSRSAWARHHVGQMEGR